MPYRIIPNGLTLSRIILALPFFLVAYASADRPWCHTLALFLFAFIILTDFLDGRLARRWNAVSLMGKELDPIADKAVVAAAYIVLASLHSNNWLLPVLAFVLIFRDFLVSLLRGFAARCQTVIAARQSGKLRTALSLSLAFLLLARIPYRTTQPPWLLQLPNAIPGVIIDAGLWVLLLWTVYSLFDYWRANRNVVWQVLNAPQG
ncbi:MAG: CDP-diacylglycerol--glycerol-3-phosphate 3-phosphatidyltransferase [Parcubacteria group bacterium Gr01-1014_31]|nr:MAG: CDP-diacylglycerol--glycerol-3-phosphate 3-phosphatidyltransferase [Parcubacteria group bacterium Gr01-1014_31]